VDVLGNSDLEAVEDITELPSFAGLYEDYNRLYQEYLLSFKVICTAVIYWYSKRIESHQKY
jgi:hypothetical protein